MVVYGYGNNFWDRDISRNIFILNMFFYLIQMLYFLIVLFQRFGRTMEQQPQLALISAIQHDINNQPIHDLSSEDSTSLEYAILSSK